MPQISKVTRSIRDLDRSKSIQAVVDGELSATKAAQRREITNRQMRRLIDRCGVSAVEAANALRAIGLLFFTRGRGG